VELISTLFSTGWASGVNAYGTVALLSILGRAGVGPIPDGLESDPILLGALVMFAIEFVVDKIPILDSAWDTVHTVIRPLIGSWLGFEFGTAAEISQLEEGVAAGGSGLTALLSHGVKAGLRLGINASPEPASNWIASFTEDGLVATVTFFALENPELAAVIAAVLLVIGLGAVITLWTKLIRPAMIRFMNRGRAADP